MTGLPSFGRESSQSFLLWIHETEEAQIKTETLLLVLSKMLGKAVVRADYQTEQLHGGTLGDVQLIAGIAETAYGQNLPYKVVWKRQKKWKRPGDPGSWRREYD